MGEQKPPAVEERLPSLEPRNLSLCPNFVANFLGQLGQLTFHLLAPLSHL